MKDRVFYIAFGGACLILLLFIGRNAVSDPLDAKRRQMDEQLARMAELPPVSGASDEVKQLALEQTIVSKKSAWTDLVPPPAPVKPPPPKPDPPPEVREMLKEVFVTRMQIGDKKVKVIHPNAPNGEWMSPGMNIVVPYEKGSATVTLKSFDRSSATFTHFWAQKNQTLSANIPRE